MDTAIQDYNNLQNDSDKEICNQLANIIDENLSDAENKIWHAHPVWFLDGNPIVGYSKLKGSVRLLFGAASRLMKKNFLTKVLLKQPNFAIPQPNRLSPKI